MNFPRDWTFKWWEVALIKLCLISLGILIALYFDNFAFALLGLWWTLFVLIAAYFIVKFFKEG